ncbi:MAG: bifunctional pyr operon transcriptional regulator/uracil phosphoribosyltransferase PyrR [Betaproteobacteria bacterium]|nr:bifunctional pyr operon transcriptional regulator/uracil phosphoribosyltransferase PyrR [Betaproteobacteria bacterium]
MAALPDAEALCASLASALAPRIGPSSAMIGIHTGGAWVAERLHAALGMKEPLGFLDIAFYRDDYDRKGLARDPKRSKIPFDVAGKDLLLVDDVLYTGRTVRAAINELFDYGRPASISLVVLVERDGRQLPICAQHAGVRVQVAAGMRLRLKRSGEGRLSLELERAA